MVASAKSIATASTEIAHWTAWTNRWNSRMAAFFPGRDDSIDLMLDLVADLVSPEPG
jgi:hypothetical protein